jgi:hypothetical protein
MAAVVCAPAGLASAMLLGSLGRSDRDASMVEGQRARQELLRPRLLHAREEAPTGACRPPQHRCPPGPAATAAPASGEARLPCNHASASTPIAALDGMSDSTVE